MKLVSGCCGWEFSETSKSSLTLPRVTENVLVLAFCCPVLICCDSLGTWLSAQPNTFPNSVKWNRLWPQKFISEHLQKWSGQPLLLYILLCSIDNISDSQLAHWKPSNVCDRLPCVLFQCDCHKMFGVDELLLPNYYCPILIKQTHNQSFTNIIIYLHISFLSPWCLHVIHII